MPPCLINRLSTVSTLQLAINKTGLLLLISIILRSVLKWRDIPTDVFKILDKFERGESQYGLKGLVVKLEHLYRSLSFSFGLRAG